MTIESLPADKARRLAALVNDWIWALLSPSGRRKLMIEHGITPQ